MRPETILLQSTRAAMKHGDLEPTKETLPPILYPRSLNHLSLRILSSVGSFTMIPDPSTPNI